MNLKTYALWTCMSNACIDLILGQSEEKSPKLARKGPKHIQMPDLNQMKNKEPQGSINLPTL